MDDFFVVVFVLTIPSKTSTKYGASLSRKCAVLLEESGREQKKKAEGEGVSNRAASKKVPYKKNAKHPYGSMRRK